MIIYRLHGNVVFSQTKKKLKLKNTPFHFATTQQESVKAQVQSVLPRLVQPISCLLCQQILSQRQTPSNQIQTCHCPCCARSYFSNQHDCTPWFFLMFFFGSTGRGNQLDLVAIKWQLRYPTTAKEEPTLRKDLSPFAPKTAQTFNSLSAPMQQEKICTHCFKILKARRTDLTSKGTFKQLAPKFECHVAWQIKLKRCKHQGCDPILPWVPKNLALEAPKKLFGMERPLHP